MPGNYIVEWRALGEDTHPTAGQFSFEVLEYEIDEEDSVTVGKVEKAEEEDPGIDEIVVSEENEQRKSNDEVIVESSAGRFLLPFLITGALALILIIRHFIKKIR